jgi:hypothetical protein
VLLTELSEVKREVKVEVEMGVKMGVKVGVKVDDTLATVQAHHSSCAQRITSMSKAN